MTRSKIDLSLPIESVEQSNNAELLRIGVQVIEKLAAPRQGCGRAAH
jgi:hypothetical protein